MGEALSITNVSQLNISRSAKELLVTLIEKAERIGESFCTAIKKKALARDLDKSSVTLNKYIKELESAELIVSSTRSGVKGGTVILFNQTQLNFGTEVTAFSAEKMDELKDYFFPKAPVKEPTKKYRSKEEILIERIRNENKRDNNDKLNAMLRETGYPTREFFNATEDPLRHFQAYLLSRMYNAYTVIFPEMRKNEYEATGNKEGFERARWQVQHYSEYDCLSQEFMGTSNFTSFLKLRDFLAERQIFPLEYLTSQFKYTEYLELNRNSKVRLPFINDLMGEAAYNRYHKDVTFYFNLYKEHPYYKTNGRLAKIKGLEYPIIQLFDSVYLNPWTLREPFKNILNNITSMGYISHKTTVLMSYSNAVLTKVAESELPEEEKAALSAYVTQQYATHLEKGALVPFQYLATYPIQMMSNRKAFDESEQQDYRAYCADLGNTAKVTEFNTDDLQVFTKLGYTLDFSMFGSKTFVGAVMAVQSIKRFDIEPRVLSKALTNFTEISIPVTPHGMFDTPKLYKEFLTEDQFAEDKENYYLFHSSDKPLDPATHLWYDVTTADTSSRDYKRDGRALIE